MELKAYDEKRFVENLAAMRRLAEGEKRVIVRAHWREPGMELNQVRFQHDFEAEIDHYVRQFNQMTDAMHEGFDNVPFFRVDFGRMAWLMSAAYGCVARHS